MIEALIAPALTPQMKTNTMEDTMTKTEHEEAFAALDTGEDGGSPALDLHDEEVLPSEDQTMVTVPMSRDEFEVLRLTDAALHALERSPDSDEHSVARVAKIPPRPDDRSVLPTERMDSYQIKKTLERAMPLSMDRGNSPGPRVPDAQTTAPGEPSAGTSGRPSPTQAHVVALLGVALAFLLVLTWLALRT